MSSENKFLGAFITVTSLFFMWGFITVFVDSLVPRLQEVFAIDPGSAGLFQTAFFCAYGLVFITILENLSLTGQCSSAPVVIAYLYLWKKK